MTGATILLRAMERRNQARLSGAMRPGAAKLTTASAAATATRIVATTGEFLKR